MMTQLYAWFILKPVEYLVLGLEHYVELVDLPMRIVLVIKLKHIAPQPFVFHNRLKVESV